MDSLTLLEKSYRKSRHAVDGEWHDKFRWCFGGDGGNDSGNDSVDEGQPTSQAAQDEADEAAAAAAAQSAEGRAGFEGWGLPGTPAPGEEEDSFGYIGVADPETGYIDPAGPLNSQASFSETFGKTPGQAIAGLLDPTIMSLALPPIAAPVIAATGLTGLPALAARMGLSLGAQKAADEAGVTGAVKEATGIDITGGIVGQVTNGYASGGPVRLQDGIGSLYGKR